jgi:cytochrome c-type biogenesis protein CcmF
MTSLLGTGLVLVGLAFAACGGVAGIIGGLQGRSEALRLARWGTVGFGVSMLLANAVMIAALLLPDFSVSYVAQVGSRATPTLFAIASLWSALEGSILFWGAVLGGYVLAYGWATRDGNPRFVSLSLGVILLTSCFFAFLIAGPANPFVATPGPVPLDGPGPNPMLQNHFLMIIHPPALYLGYVGMVIPFAIAVAGLLGTTPGAVWVPLLRRWTLIPWIFLTLGIVLGGWWAYAVLGWGGYWAWDPVENASLLPWLTATAFMHSAIVQERRRMLPVWTVSLALLTFWLTILGTFMTRSGIFNSVHSFTQSDIGPVFLVFLAILGAFCVGLLVVRGPTMMSGEGAKSPASREAAMLGANLVLVAFTFTVLLGTVFPLLVEAIQDRRISVGEPYFNRFAVPLGMMLLFLMGVGPSLPWGAADLKAVGRRLLVPGVSLVAGIVLALAFGITGFQALFTFGLAGFAGAVTLREMFLPTWVRMREHKESLPVALTESISRGRRRFGGFVVHLAVVVMVVGIAASSVKVLATSGTVKPGGTLNIGSHSLTFVGMEQGQEPHRTFSAAVMAVDGTSELIRPRLNYYRNSMDPIGTPAVRTTLNTDLYVSLMAYDPEKNTATFRAWIFPLVGLIWWSMPLFALGTGISMWPQRRKVTAEASVPEPVIAPGGMS